MSATLFNATVLLGKHIPIVMGFPLTKHEIAPYQDRPAVKSNVRALNKHLPDANPAKKYFVLAASVNQTKIGDRTSTHDASAEIRIKPTLHRLDH